MKTHRYRFWCDNNANFIYNTETLMILFEITIQNILTNIELCGII